MKEDLMNVAGKIRSFMKDEEYIPGRFSAWNTLAWVLGLATPLAVLKKNPYILVAIMCLEPLCCLKMNKEMAKFMEAMLEKKGV